MRPVYEKQTFELVFSLRFEMKEVFCFGNEPSQKHV